MKITVTAHKPRNPIVAHAQFRRAGSHRPGGGASRQQASAHAATRTGTTETQPMNAARPAALPPMKETIMSSLKDLALEPRRPPAPATRRGAPPRRPSSLRRASAVLARLSRRLARPAAQPVQAEPQLEFYAEAGAPEGALYLDGKLVGWVSGVTRL